MLTSDSDAPAPWVGNYPFRRSKKGLQDDNDTKALKAKKDAHNTELSKAFGSLSNSFGNTNTNTSANIDTNTTNTTNTNTNDTIILILMILILILIY